MQLNLYGLLVGVGIVVALQVAVSLMEMKGEDGSMVWDGLWWMLVPGVVAARAYHVIDRWDYYRDNLGAIWQIWQGGLGILGAIVGGVLGLAAFSILRARRQERKAEELFFAIADVVVMGLVLGQAIGRWGNYFNQELYGLKTRLPWGIEVEGLSGLYHPLFLYESVLSIALFVVLLVMYKRGEVKGSVFGGYLIGYGLIRMLLEGLRYESWMVGGFQVARMVGLGFVLAGILVLRRKRDYLRDEDMKITRQE